MTRRIAYSPRAREQLTDLTKGIADESGQQERAAGYMAALLDDYGGRDDESFIAAEPR